MVKTFFIADTHFGHFNIIGYCNRPFKDTETMDDEMIKNWNNVVSKQDKVFFLGDFSFQSEEKIKEISNKLHGYKVLILGNHDRKNMKFWYDAGFSEVYKYPIIVDDYLFLSHQPQEFIPQNTPYFYLYGHVHDTEMYKTITKTSACVCVERWNYTPVELTKIQDLVKLL